MRSAARLLLTLGVVLAPLPAAAAAQDVACPDELTALGETWARGSTTVTLDAAPNYQNKKCAYAGPSGGASFALWWQPPSKPDFFGQAADNACLQPGASTRDLTFARDVEARVVHSGTSGSATHVQSVGQQLLALIEPLAQPCPPVPCPATHDFGAGPVNLTGSAGPQNASSMSFASGQARQHGCSYSTTLKDGRIFLVRVTTTWVNVTPPRYVHWACDRTVDPNPLVHRAFDETLQLGTQVEFGSRTNATNASAQELGRSVLAQVRALGIASDAVACPARAPPSPTPAATPALGSPTPTPTPTPTLPICPARYALGAGPASALVASRWQNDTAKGVAGAVCAYELPPDETEADLVSAGRITFVADYRIAPGAPSFGCVYAGDLRTSFPSATHQASIRWDERMARWGNATKFAANAMMPLVERFALPCSPEDVAARDAAPCPDRVTVTFSTGGETDRMRLVRQRPIQRDAATGWGRIDCAFEQSGESRLSFSFSVTTTWAPKDAASTPHWACVRTQVPALPARSFPVGGGVAMGTDYTDSGGFASVFDEVAGLIFRLHEAMEDRAASCAGAQPTDVGGVVDRAVETPGAGLVWVLVAALAGGLRRRDP